MAFTYITGSGTHADPYVISNVNGWNEWATYVRDGNTMEGEYIELGADIPANINYSNIADNGYSSYSSLAQVGYSRSSSSPYYYPNNSDHKCFCGNFNGNGHYVCGCYGGSGGSYDPLIYCSKNCTIQNTEFMIGRIAIEYIVLNETSDTTYNFNITNNVFHKVSVESSIRIVSNTTNRSNNETGLHKLNLYIINCIFDYIYYASNYNSSYHSSEGMCTEIYLYNNKNVTVNYNIYDCLFINTTARPVPSKLGMMQYSTDCYVNPNIQRIVYYINNYIEPTGNPVLPLEHTYEKHNYMIFDGDTTILKTYFPYVENPTFDQWYYLNTVKAQNPSNYKENHLNFTDVWSIDTVLKIPVPKYWSERFVYVLARYNGDDIYVNTNQLKHYYTGSSSFSNSLITNGPVGLVKRGSNIQFGIKAQNDQTIFDRLTVTNITTGHTGSDYQVYENVQSNIYSNYILKPNLSGSGTQADPYVISSYNDLKTYLSVFNDCRYFSVPLTTDSDLNNLYFILTSDIICNDITNYNIWSSSSQPTNLIHGNYCGHLDGQNHKIIGLCLNGRNSSNNSVIGAGGSQYVTLNYSISNVIFDYVHSLNNSNNYLFFKNGYYESGTLTITNCEFNGNCYFGTYNSSQTSSIIFRKCHFTLCYLNITNISNTDKTNNYRYYGIISSSSASVAFEDCVIISNQNFYNANNSGYISFNRCVFVGKYTCFESNDIHISSCYILKNSLNGDSVQDLTVIKDNEGMVQSKYPELDFTNTFAMNEYHPILQNHPVRFNVILALTNDKYTKNSNTSYISYFITITQTGGWFFENNNQNHTANISLSYNSTFIKLKWEDGTTSSTKALTSKTNLFTSVQSLLRIQGLDGEGTESSPYLIKNKENLIIFSTFTKNLTNSSTGLGSNSPYVYVKLTNDIQYQDDSAWETWETTDAAESWESITQISCEFDGDNHKISGLYKKDNYNSYSSNSFEFHGLFFGDKITNNNHSYQTDKLIVVKNLTIEHSVLKVLKQNYRIIVGICYGAKSQIHNCKFNGKILVSIDGSGNSGNLYRMFVGGISAFKCNQSSGSDIDTTISNCKFNGKIIVTWQNKSFPVSIGGILGGDNYYSPRNTKVKNCTMNGSIELNNQFYNQSYDENSYVGGIVGMKFGGNGEQQFVEECYNRASITIICNRSNNSYKLYVGGIVGGGWGGIKNCYNNGIITLTDDNTSYNNNSYCSGVNCNHGTSAITEKSYNYAQIIGPENSQNIKAIANLTGTVSNCYYLENTAPNAGGGNVLNAAQFAVTSNFSGYDFINVWEMDNAAGRPKLINNFEGELSTLIVTSSNPDYGIATGGGDYEYGEVVEIEAFPYAGCAFEAWSDGSRTNPRFITVRRNMMFQALFSGAYPIRLLDYYGLIQLWSELQLYAAQKLSTKVDKTSAGDSDTPVYFNSAGIPTPCTSLDLNTSGNAGSATKLETSRNISGVPFDGTTDITITPSNIGLGNVNNTSDLDKPISNATQNALMLLESDIDKVSYDNITYRMIDDIFNS